MNQNDKTTCGTPREFDLAEQITFDLRVIRRLLHRPIESEMAKGELTAPQMAVMQVVVRAEGISLKDLSREVGLAHSTVSGIVDRLERRGMLERRADGGDGRLVRLHPTREVTRFVHERIPKLSRGPVEAALERATQADRQAISQAVRRLRELLEQTGGAE